MIVTKFTCVITGVKFNKLNSLNLLSVFIHNSFIAFVVYALQKKKKNVFQYFDVIHVDTIVE